MIVLRCNPSRLVRRRPIIIRGVHPPLTSGPQAAGPFPRGRFAGNLVVIVCIRTELILDRWNLHGRSSWIFVTTCLLYYNTVDNTKNAGKASEARRNET